jgi:hypothetical protein
LIKFRPGGAFAGQTFAMDDSDLSYQSAYGKSFRVRRADIGTVVVDAVGAGKARLKIIGHGTDLASVELPTTWAEKARTWILDHREGPLPEAPPGKGVPKWVTVPFLILGALFASCMLLVTRP